MASTVTTFATYLGRGSQDGLDVMSSDDEDVYFDDDEEEDEEEHEMEISKQESLDDISPPFDFNDQENKEEKEDVNEETIQGAENCNVSLPENQKMVREEGIINVVDEDPIQREENKTDEEVQSGTLVPNSIAFDTTKPSGRSQSDSSIILKVETPLKNSLLLSPNAPRKRYSSKQTLPTLDETSDSLEFSCMDMNMRSMSCDQVNLDWATASPVKPAKKPYVPRQKKPTKLEKVKELQETASDLAQRGDEEEALKVYRKALQIAGSEISRINSQIQKQTYKSKFSGSSPMPVAAIKSIQNRIQEDLMTMGERIGKIRIVMTILHERMGEYDKAIECCKEATQVYKHQPLLRLMKDTTSTDEAEIVENETRSKDRLRDVQKVMHRLKVAKSFVEIRQKVLGVMASIRQDIINIDVSTSDGRSTRDSLYQRFHELALSQLKKEIQALGPTHPQIPETLQLLSNLAVDQGQHDDAVNFLQDARRILKSTMGMKHPRTAQVYLRLARLHRGFPNGAIGKSREKHEDLSMEYFTKAAQILRASKLRPNLLGSTLNDTAIIHMKRGDFKIAIDLLKEALKRYEENTESLTTGAALELSASGTSRESSDSGFSLDEEREDEAGDTVSGSSNSNSSSGNSNGINNGSLSIDALQVWRNLGECYSKLDDYENAKEAFANALEIQRSARMIHDAVVKLDLGIVGVEKGMLKLVDDQSIFDTLTRLGKSCAASGKHQEALVAHKEALELINEIAVEEELHQDLTSRQIRMRRHALKDTLLCIASACVEVEKYDEAMKFFRDSIQHSRLSNAFSKSNREQMSETLHCVKCFVGMADAYLKQEKYPDALKLYNNAAKYCEKKGVSDDTEIVKSIRNKRLETERRITELPRSNEKVGKLEARALEEMSSGRLDDSILTLTEAMGILRSSFTQAKLAGFDCAEHLCAMARILQTLASIFLEKGEEENAERAFRDAAKLFKESGAEESIEC